MASGARFAMVRRCCLLLFAAHLLSVQYTACMAECWNLGVRCTCHDRQSGPIQTQPAPVLLVLMPAGAAAASAADAATAAGAIVGCLLEMLLHSRASSCSLRCRVVGQQGCGGGVQATGSRDHWHCGEECHLWPRNWHHLADCVSAYSLLGHAAFTFRPRMPAQCINETGYATVLCAEPPAWVVS